MAEKTVVVRYDEIGLKGQNRSFFEKALVDNLKSALCKDWQAHVSKIRGRILIDAPEKYIDEIIKKAAHVPGVHSLSHGDRLERDMEVWKSHALKKLKTWTKKFPVSFRITCKRSDKTFPQTSAEINAIIGAHLIDAMGSDQLNVQLKDPEVNIHLDIYGRFAVMFADHIPGPGGLPVGTAGDVLCLLSGGIDSPVAAYQMMRRGCRVHHVFFENRTFLGRAAYHKVEMLAKILNEIQLGSRLMVVPFSDIQVAIRDHCSSKNRVILYRRFMFRIAEALLREHRYKGLVTGECLGQVASQTLENMAAVDTVVGCPIYRPLIASDKIDIQNCAKKIGTYETSIVDAPDCCSVFMPKRPVTRARVELLERDEQKLDVSELEAKALENCEVEEWL